MDKLTQYLESVGQRPSDFARVLGTSPGYLHDILTQRRRPSLDLAMRIERATGGCVPVQVWVPEPETAP